MYRPSMCVYSTPRRVGLWASCALVIAAGVSLFLGSASSHHLSRDTHLLVLAILVSPIAAVVLSILLERPLLSMDLHSTEIYKSLLPLPGTSEDIELKNISRKMSLGTEQESEGTDDTESSEASDNFFQTRMNNYLPQRESVRVDVLRWNFGVVLLLVQLLICAASSAVVLTHVLSLSAADQVMTCSWQFAMRLWIAVDDADLCCYFHINPVE